MTSTRAKTISARAFIMMGQSNMLGEGRKDGMKGGDLECAVKTEGKYSYLWDQITGNWSVSKNVRSQSAYIYRSR
jgi:hypothetical protein